MSDGVAEERHSKVREGTYRRLGKTTVMGIAGWDGGGRAASPEGEK
jgi:hypothetical protein